MPSVDIQDVSGSDYVPAQDVFIEWVSRALPNDIQEKNISIRVVDEEEIQALNLKYRNMDKTTNVLSFPCELPEGVTDPLLGDIVICASILEKEAQQLHKTLEAHWAHIVVHGTLHLLGYDHVKDSDAQIMEALETKILTNMGFPEPYAGNSDYSNSDSSNCDPGNRDLSSLISSKSSSKHL